jgi:hypothetical protein
MSNILTAVKEGIQSYLDRVYSRSSFNQMWRLKYWIFWIIVIVVLFQKFRLSFLHFTFTVEMYKDVSKYHEERDYLQNVKKRYKLIVTHISKYCVILSCFY